MFAPKYEGDAKVLMIVISNSTPSAAKLMRNKRELFINQTQRCISMSFIPHSPFIQGGAGMPV